MINQPQQDLTYSDVFLVPSRSETASRFDVDLTSDDPTASPTPLIAANMTAVTGRRMVETMARRGGLGVLPQDIPVEVIADVTAWVKSKHRSLETPLRVFTQDTVLDVRHLLDKRNHDAVCVVDEGRRLAGIVSASDCEGVDPFSSVGAVMRMPQVRFSLSETEGEKGLQRCFDALLESGAGYAPVADDDGVLVGALTRAGALRSTLYTPNLDANGALKVAAAVGINGDVEAKAASLLEAGVDVLVVDTAHGHQQKMFEALAHVRRTVDGSGRQVPVVAGNVVTAAGTEELIEHGADIVKVGVGPGAMCTTRMMTAVGRPQLSAVLECAAAARAQGKHIWADGGVRYPRDIALALAAGASQVMVGSWFAGTLESPGDLMTGTDGRRYKESFGMASARAVSHRTSTESEFTRARKALFEEGISSSTMFLDPKRPSVEDLIDSIVAGTRSSFTYAGAMNQAEFRDRAVMGIQSAAGYEEGKPQSSSW